MSDTVELLLKIKNLTNHFKSAITEIINKKKEINNILIDNDNIQYDNINDIIEKLENNFNEEPLNILINLINLYNKEIDDKINNFCDHLIVVDDIDISLDESKRIKYCKKCELTF
jgi:hypothetical protein